MLLILTAQAGFGKRFRITMGIIATESVVRLWIRAVNAAIVAA